MQIDAAPDAAATIGIKRPLEQPQSSEMFTAPKQQKVLAVVETTPEKSNGPLSRVESEDTIEVVSTTIVQKDAPSPGTQALITAVVPTPAPQETSVAKQHEKMQVDEPKGNGVTSTLVEANNGMQVEEAKDVLPSPPENVGQEVSDGPLPPAEVPTKVLTPAELAMEKVKKAEEAFKASHNELEKKERAIQEKIDENAEAKEYDLWLTSLARDLTSMDPVKDAVSECVIDLLADVQEMYYDKENPWDPREHEELNYDKVDLIEIPTKNSMEDNSSKNSNGELLAPKIPVDNHPTYYTEHFLKIFNEFSYCNIQFLSLSFEAGPLG